MNPPWSIRIQDESPLCLVAMVSGDGYVVPDEADIVALRPGDVAVLRGPDPYTVSGDPTTPPQRIRASYTLVQTFLSTRLEIVPDFGEFPDNALLVVEVTNEVKDFGGNPLIPMAFSFVTENRVAQCGTRSLPFDGDPPIDLVARGIQGDTATIARLLACARVIRGMAPGVRLPIEAPLWMWW
jgi:hypothetical protein